MRFADPQYLWLLIVIPILFILRLVDGRSITWKKRKLGDPSLVQQMFMNYSVKRGWIKFLLLMSVLFLLIICIARPQMGTKLSQEKRDGIEVVVALDISNSMLARDVVPSRLEKSKLLLQNMIDHFNNDKVGIVVFAGDAFVQLPITNDFVSAKMFLQSIAPSLITTQGTDISTALRVSAASFTQAQGVGRAIIVITDGEDHEGGAEDAAKKVHDKGINVVVMGVGSSKGSPIPLGDNSYMKDRMGNTVMTHLNEEMCHEVANAGKGVYIHVDNTSSSQEQLDAFLSQLQHGETENVSYSEYAEQTPWIAFLALILLIVEAVLPRRSNKKFNRLSAYIKDNSLFRRKAMFFLMLIIPACYVQAQQERQNISTGNKYYKQGDYARAEAEYIKAIDKNPNNAQAVYNYGCSLLAQQQDSSAIVQFESSAKMEKSSLRRSRSYHNIGFICQKHQLYDDAIEAYKESLRLNPSDDETRYNLALCQRLRKNGENSSSNKKEEGKDKQDQQQQDQKREQQQKKNNSLDRNKMSRDNAERLLNAAMQQEKATQQRMKDTQQQGSRSLEKNW